MSDCDLFSRVRADTKTALSSTGDLTATVKTLARSLDITISGEHDTGTNSTGSRAKSTSERSTKAVPKKKGISAATRITVYEEKTTSFTAQERSTLAVDVVNTVLKLLNEASTKASKITQRAAGSGLARDKDASIHLKNISPNRTSPPLDTKKNIGNKQELQIGHFDNNVHGLVDCGRLAFEYLATSRLGKSNNGAASRHQLENGMMTFIGQLIVLRSFHFALSQLCLLKKLLQANSTSNSSGDIDRNHSKAHFESAKDPCPCFDRPRLLDLDKSLASNASQQVVVGYQLLVLKLLAADPRTSELPMVANLADFKHPGSPVNHLTNMSTEAHLHDFAVKQLESVARNMLAFCANTATVSKQMSSAEKQRSNAISYIQLQSTALAARIVSKNLQSPQDCSYDQVFQSFLKYVKILDRKSSCATEGYYTAANDAFMLLKDKAKYNHGAQVDKSPRFERLLDEIQLQLATIAEDVGLYSEAYRIVQVLVLKQSNMQYTSQAQRCSLSIRCVALMLKGSAAEVDETVLKRNISTTVDLLTGDLTGTTVELENILQEISELQSPCVRILRLKADGGNATVLRDGCRNIIQPCIRFLCRYHDVKLNCPSREHEQMETNLSSSIFESASRAFIESALLNLRVEQPSDVQAFSSAENALRESLKLCERISSKQRGAETGAESYNNSVVEDFDQLRFKISDMCWFLSSKARALSDDATLTPSTRLLQLSCDALYGCKLSREQATTLSNKLYKLTTALQAAGQVSEGIRVALASVKQMIELGTLYDIEESAATFGLYSAWTSGDRVRILGSTLKTLLELHIKFDSADTTKTLFYDDPCLCTVQRGLLLEWQLSTLFKWRNSSKLKIIVQKTCKRISEILLSLYDKTGYPVRRRRALVVMLQIMPLDEDLIACSSELVSIDSFDARKASCDGGLGRYLDSLQCSLATFLLYQSSTTELRDIELVVQRWTKLTESSTSREDVEKTVEDYDSWLSLLDSLADYLDVQGLHFDQIRVLSLLLKLHGVSSESTADKTFSIHLRQGLLFLRLGYTGRAGLCFARAYSRAGKLGRTEKAQCDLAYVEYFVALRDLDSCKQHAQVFQPWLESEDFGESTTLQSINSNADALFSYSLYRLEHGSQLEALYYAKRSLALLQGAWKGLENNGPAKTSQQRSVSTDVDQLVNGMSKLKVDAQAQAQSSGPRFWPLASRLFRALLHTCSLLESCGLFAEALNHVMQAETLARGLSARALLRHALAIKGHYLCRAGRVEEGRTSINEADKLGADLGISRERALFHCYQGYGYRLAGEYVEEQKAYEEALTIFDELSSPSFIAQLDGPQAPPDPREKGDVSTRSKKKAPSRRKKVVPSEAGNAEEKVATSRMHSVADECQRLVMSRNEVMIWSAESKLAQGDVEGAKRMLVDGVAMRTTSVEASALHRTLIARRLVVDSTSQLAADAVYGMLVESPLSFPSVVRHGHGHGRWNVTDGADSAAAPKDRSRTKVQAKADATITLLLQQAVDMAAEDLPRLSRTGSLSTLAKMCSSFITASMYLSSTSTTSTSLQSSLVAYSTDLPNCMAQIREQGCVVVDKALRLNSRPNEIKQAQVDEGEREERHFAPGRFQCDFVDLIPKAWNVISMSLDDERKHIRFVRYQARRAPFVLQLPLSRQNGEEAEAEAEAEESSSTSLTFDEARAELRDIIASSDATVHGSRDRAQELEVKGAKMKWWATREALDARLHQLLANIEERWIGGFRGILAPSCVDDGGGETLARFHQSFERALDRHLPSRQRGGGGGGRRGAGGGRSGLDKTELDARVMELFVSLVSLADDDDDDDDETQDVEPALTDLVYFVVDILQFRGEQNAYDEIDFDALLVDILDAMQSYRETLRRGGGDKHKTTDTHTILILDKHLHAFPWESLPLLAGRAVSRLTCLTELRDRLLNMSLHGKSKGKGKECKEEEAAGMLASTTAGSYMLNPSGDLGRTQTRFEASLGALQRQSWTGIVGRAPQEAEFVAALASSTRSSSARSGCGSASKVLLYFGHGSGAQYVRSRSIKRLAACGVALLFGCSSASLAQAGEYEAWGTPRAYMLAGAPALLGSLWDVTDGDVDCFAQGVLERWGLLQEEKKKKDEEQQQQQQQQQQGQRQRRTAAARRRKGPLLQKTKTEMKSKTKMSLSAAATLSRGECHLRYLNGAAMVVYGVPVFLDAAAADADADAALQKE